ncbi:hypothetical protein BU24DRAFT_451879 [Aaosphaeria arxii CBS 175.79]|uniref:Uncharacterized protein n=1 Tax=Aaosphaeria arxii CBS 175.79 TaxID=1450172 RepID=A0A6A5XRN6_9PLEO|nr:uncharacterized protein BU24DRAFT_451879 [Aaosphaeria arxii CBS 175.79]KAF2014964.1 hypothetical protein BU24DRAFT_451879 [Aaosphaeria arxii CBS 175.79]
MKTETSLSPFESLPPELHDEILSHLATPLQTPKQISTDHRWNDSRADTYALVRRMTANESHGYESTLYAMRLVCRTLLRAATRALCRRFAIVLPIFEDGVVDFISSLSSPSPSSSYFVDAVRGVCIPLSSREMYFPRRTLSTEGDANGGLDRIRDFMVAFQGLLARKGVGERVECLNVTLPYVWESDSSGGGHDGYDKVPVFDVNMLDGLRVYFADLLGMPGGVWANLTDLRLAMPAAVDCSVLGVVLGDEMLGRLRHLYLRYMDATGPGGSKAYLSCFDENTDGDERVGMSNLQKEYPNRTYGPDLCKIVNRCPNLESLGLAGTQHIDCTLLDFKPRRGGGLRMLYLDRVKITFEKLIELFSTDEGGVASELRSLWMHDVELQTGTWGDVFQHLIKNCPELSYFCPDSLVYDRNGESSDLKEYHYRAWEDIQPVFTADYRDVELVQELINKVVKQAGGLDNYPDDHLESMWADDIDLNDDEEE